MDHHSWDLSKTRIWKRIKPLLPGIIRKLTIGKYRSWKLEGLVQNSSWDHEIPLNLHLQIIYPELKNFQWKRKMIGVPLSPAPDVQLDGPEEDLIHFPI